MNVRWAAGWAAAIALGGVGLALVLAPGPEYGEGLKVSPPPGWVNPAISSLGRYLRLDNWDSVHFVDIGMSGYRLPEGEVTRDDVVQSYRANVTFLPAYPLALGVVARVLGVSGQVAALVTAQGACFVFWMFLLLWLRRQGLSRGRALGVTWLLFAYPSSFYLVAGYTESLYLAALVGFVFFTDCVAEVKTPAWGAGLGAITCGILMTGSRLVGLPAIVYPATRGALGKCPPKVRAWLYVISFASSFGALGFFLYCRLRFGHWDLYFRLLEIGWGQSNSMFGFLFDPRSYLPHFFFEDTHVSLNRAAVPLSLALLYWGARDEWGSGDRRGTALRLTGLALLYLAMAGKAASGMDGMIRYSLPVFLLVLMARAASGRPFRREWWVAAFTIFAICQLYLLRRYLLGHWVS